MKHLIATQNCNNAIECTCHTSPPLEFCVLRKSVRWIKKN